jgi:hypothetical protein
MMGGNVMCNFCCEYRDCFEVVRQNGKEKFEMCYRCAYNYQGKDVWREVKKEEVNA